MRFVLVLALGISASTCAEAQEAPTSFARKAVSDPVSEKFFTPRLKRNWDRMLARNKGCAEVPGLGAFIADSQDGTAGRPKLLLRDIEPRETAFVEFGRKPNSTMVTLVRMGNSWRIDEACNEAGCYSEVLRKHRCGN
jgi:hypothetical protein